MLADAPTARLDAARSPEIGELLVAPGREIGATVVCATDDPHLVGLVDRDCGCASRPG